MRDVQVYGGGGDDDDVFEEEELEVEEDEDESEAEEAVGISYEEGKVLLAEALGREVLATPDELREAFDGHADYLHDDRRNAAYRAAIDVAAKGSR